MRDLARPAFPSHEASSPDPRRKARRHSLGARVAHQVEVMAGAKSDLVANDLLPAALMVS